MEKSNPTKQEAVGDRLFKDISQLEQVSLGEGAAMCQVCGFDLREGAVVRVYVFRPAGEAVFRVGRVVCGAGEHERLDVFTLGVRELVVEGRVGWCWDVVSQSSWPVLLAPVVVGVSAAATKTLRIVPESAGKASGAAPSVGADAAYGAGRSDAGPGVCGECGGEL